MKYATACSDSIPDLHIFKANCKPLFLFLAQGVPVAHVHGADARKMRDKIENEVEKELQVLNGDLTRNPISFEDVLSTSNISDDSEELEEDRN